MPRYLVHGTIMEYMADLHVQAPSPEAAIAAWYEAHKEVGPSFCPRATDIDQDQHMARFWRGNGYKYYSGGYKYYL